MSISPGPTRGRGPSPRVHVHSMKTTPATTITGTAAVILGAIAYPQAPRLAITAWVLTGVAVVALAAAHIIGKRTR